MKEGWQDRIVVDVLLVLSTAYFAIDRKYKRERQSKETKKKNEVNHRENLKGFTGFLRGKFFRRGVRQMPKK